VAVVATGMVWILMTFYGPLDVDGQVYISQHNCETALKRLERSERCTPAQGENSCISGPNPARRCVQMKFAPDQIVQRIHP
jgi:hypothetical protein